MHRVEIEHQPVPHRYGGRRMAAVRGEAQHRIAAVAQLIGQHRHRTRRADGLIGLQRQA